MHDDRSHYYHKICTTVPSHRHAAFQLLDTFVCAFRLQTKVSCVNFGANDVVITIYVWQRGVHYY